MSTWLYIGGTTKAIGTTVDVKKGRIGTKYVKFLKEKVKN